MAAGKPAFRLLQLEDNAGNAQSYANAAAFTGAGWALAWKDGLGVALGSPPTYTITDLSNGLHLVAFTEPSKAATGGWMAKITVPAGYYTPQLALRGDGDPYDIADVEASILALTASSISTAAPRTGDTLEDWVDGDSFDLNIVITSAQLAEIGLSNLTGATVRAGFKQAFPTKNSQDAEDIDATADITDAVACTVRVHVDAFPAGSKLASGIDRVDYVLDITVKNNADGRIYTAQRYFVAIVWQADTRNA